MPKIPALADMLEAGMHFGHRTSRWHPKMEPFIFGAKSGVHIIDLEASQKQLQDALDFVKGVAARGGTVLFVGTKPQAKAAVREAAQRAGMPHVTERWLGGTLTNFPQIKKTLKRLKTLKDQREKGELKKYTKKEQLMIDREIEEMEHKMGGIAEVERLPDAIFIVDVKTEKTALTEASVTGTKVVALCDTNVNPSSVAYVIPGNDDAAKTIELIAHLVSDAVKEGKAEALKAAAAPEKKE
ncbi:30S ribosomal protein S2 [Candidatus Uhrbacteria bacterium RIFCSPHIGHO2_01_FULL_63_20]|uniref:Small ribosomal subunit protein uS2 n=1 Tax=Candidatus Uhrbacteria bacterium RIFCSPHIGHO2_01_FULL_63_20 TaxID=1802385 RepID=A0A1F7TL66_9BACT|nr:MAG: 30S ribosomal protein S2 [Candidatus Uhrbacteria bacterium RIFCSPHIGHO2_01_FULL_63_20]